MKGRERVWNYPHYHNQYFNPIRRPYRSTILPTHPNAVSGLNPMALSDLAWCWLSPMRATLSPLCVRSMVSRRNGLGFRGRPDSHLPHTNLDQKTDHRRASPGSEALPCSSSSVRIPATVPRQRGEAREVREHKCAVELRAVVHRPEGVREA